MARLWRGIGLGGLALVCALASVGMAGPAHAIWPFTRNDKSDIEVVDPVTYTFSLDVVGGNRSLDKQLRNGSALYSRRKTPTSGVVGLLARSRQDIGQLTAILYSHGRYAGEVFITIDGRPLDSWSPFDSIGAQPASVHVEVIAGAQFVFGAVEAGPLPPGMTIADLDMVPGELAASDVIVAAESKIVAGWKNEGHPLARIGSSEIVANHATKTLDVHIRADPGPAADFGHVTVVGTERVDPELVYRRADIVPGTEYSAITTRAAENRLRDLGVFESVRIIPADYVNPDGTIPIEIVVSERKRHVIGGGVNYSNTEGAGAELYWQHRNLWGGAESLRLSAEVSRLFDPDVSTPDFNVGAKFTKPAVFGPMTDFNLRTEAFRETTDAYRVTTGEIEAGLTQTFTDKLSGAVAVEIERTRTEDAIPEEDYLIATLLTSVTWDGRDNKLDPSSGIRLMLEAAPAYEFRNDVPFATFSEDFSAYYAVDQDKRFVLAGRVAAGIVTVDNIKDVVANRRLYAGGPGSVRGYGYQNIGPRNKKGELIGGRSNFAVSGELRYRITESIGVVGFVDAGNAYKDIVPDVADLKVGVGAGVRYLTPVGPLRVDVAFPLEPGKDDPSWALYIGLGQAF